MSLQVARVAAVMPRGRRQHPRRWQHPEHVEMYLLRNLVQVSRCGSLGGFNHNGLRHEVPKLLRVRRRQRWVVAPLDVLHQMVQRIMWLVPSFDRSLLENERRVQRGHLVKHASQ